MGASRTRAEPSHARWLFTKVSISTGPLRRAVSLRPTSRLTFLVGRNGVGKSLFVDGFHDLAQLAVGKQRNAHASHLQTQVLDVEIRSRDGKSRIGYRYESRPLKGADHPFEVLERAVSLPSGAKLWETKFGLIHLKSDKATRLQLPSGMSLLSVGPIPSSIAGHQAEIAALKAALGAIDIVPAGLPRGASKRVAQYLQRSTKMDAVWEMQSPQNGRIDTLIRAVMNWKSNEPERFYEFAAIGSRLRLWREIDTKVLTGALSDTASKKVNDFGYLVADGLNFALLSDGSLRAAEIVAHLVSRHSATLLIEEPETSIHPGLLSRIVGEFDAYSRRKQIIVSTHSPDVIRGASPSQLRLVHRSKEGTRIDPIPRAYARRITRHLQDDGSVGEYLFGGMTDVQDDQANESEE